MMATVVNLKTAAVTTLTVSIKALTINNKQVTLALFRQIPDCHPYEFTENDGEAWFNYNRENYWGYVRYKGIEYLLWQDGNTLYKCAPKTRTYRGDLKVPYADRWDGYYSYEYWNNWREDWGLADLPQLFIAV